jgi:AcrR family transcriptional regulator
MMSQNLHEGLRERKRRATGLRIATEAARLVLAQGMAATTVDQIAEAAEVGRASFFRYFDTKERAIAEGFIGVWITMVTEAIAAQPADLSALEAVRAAFSDLARGFDQIRDLTLSQAKMARSSPALSAWTLQVYLSYEDAIATVIEPRFDDLDVGDPRPRLVGALIMAAIRLALDDWVASEGSTDLARLINRSLSAITLEPVPVTSR